LSVHYVCKGLRLTSVNPLKGSRRRTMTFLFETFLPVAVLLGACMISMGLVMCLMTLGMPDEK